jgi:hypothetical protein
VRTRNMPSAVMAPSPREKPAHHDFLAAIWFAMVTFIGPGGAAIENPRKIPAIRLLKIAGPRIVK